MFILKVKPIVAGRTRFHGSGNRSPKTAMITAMATHQESIHERLQAPEEPMYLHHATTSWSETGDGDNDNQEESAEASPYYNMPKRNKRKNFKPRCAPNATTFSDESNGAHCDAGSPVNGDRTSPDDDNKDQDSNDYMKISVKNFSLMKRGAVDLSRRLSTDSNENIDASYQNRLPDDKKMESFQRSYIDSLQRSPDDENRDRPVLNYSSLQNKSFSAKNPFAISQLIKTNSPPRRRESYGSDDGDESKVNQDINANDRLEGQEGMDTTEMHSNGEANNTTNKILGDYAMHTMKELLGIYGLSSNEVADAITGQIRALEALQGKQGNNVYYFI